MPEQEGRLRKGAAKLRVANERNRNGEGTPQWKEGSSG